MMVALELVIQFSLSLSLIFLLVGTADILAAAHAIFQAHNVRELIMNISIFLQTNFQPW